jgi:hypothetical protein
MPGDRVMLTEIIDGPVASIDRVYAFDRIRDLCRATPRAVRRARTRLTSLPEPTPDWRVAAEGTLIGEINGVRGRLGLAPILQGDPTSE